MTASEGPRNWLRALGDPWVTLSRKQFLVAAGLGVARVAGFATGAIVARALGPMDFGSYTIGFTVFSSLMQLTSFADTWLVSRWDESDRRKGASHTVWLIKSLALGLTVAAALLVAWAAPGALHRLGTNVGALLIGVCAAGAAGLTTALASIQQAQGRFGTFAMFIAAGPCGGLLLTGAAWWSHARSPTTYLLAIAIAYLPTAIATTLRLRQPVAPDIASTLLRDALKFGGWVTIGTIAYVVFQRLDVFILAAVTDQRDVGIYGVATRLQTVGAFLTNTITTVLMPPGSQRRTWVEPAARRAYVLESVLSIVPMTVLLGAVIAFAPILVRVVFGAAFVDATSATRLLLIAQALLLVQMPFYFAFYALDGGRWIAALGIGQLVISSGLGYLLIRGFGSVGAAWSNIATYGVGLAVVIVFHRVRHRSRVRIS